jgi:hypothetical protein
MDKHWRIRLLCPPIKTVKTREITGLIISYGDIAAEFGAFRQPGFPARIGQ